jgi:hypothetical protein
MKTYQVFVFAFSLLVVQKVNAQNKLPQLSPTVKLETTIGLTPVSLNYSRPSKKGRKIFGDLVPYDALWRTGANYNSVIAFGDTVIIGRTKLPKGFYEIITKPGKNTWDVYFYAQTGNINIPKDWDENKILAEIRVTPRNIPAIETFTLNIGNVTNGSFDLEIMWDNILVPVRIEVPTDKKVSQNIAEAFNGPGAWDYFLFARYYSEEKKELDQALAWINKSIEMFGDINNAWLYTQKATIEADMGNYKAAIVSAQKSLENAMKSNDTVTIKLNRESIEAWSKK